MKYKVILEESDEGFAASVPYFPGPFARRNRGEALANIADAIREYLEVVGERYQGANVREVEVEVWTCRDYRVSIISMPFAL